MPTVCPGAGPPPPPPPTDPEQPAAAAVPTAPRTATSRQTVPRGPRRPPRGAPANECVVLLSVGVIFLPLRLTDERAQLRANARTSHTGPSSNGRRPTSLPPGCRPRCRFASLRDK